MSLIPCPECGREISTEAEACPQCGHPNRPAAKAEPGGTGPVCYACSSAATTRCQSCGALSCALHLNSIYVSHGRGGAYELRCQNCYSSAMVLKIVFGVVFGIVALFILVMFFRLGGLR